MSPLYGGMEHQTMTTMGTAAYSDVTLISHELGHQWWGNNVTYGTWKDIWLSEGFASYCEQIFVEHFWGAQAVINYRMNVVNNAYDAQKSTYVDDTTDAWRIFRTSTTYKKGAMIAHMLRYLAPADSQYFKALKKYQQQYAKGLAVTTDLQNIFQQEYGTNLDSFFRQWVYGIGYPTYTAKWYQDGNHMVGIQLKQTTANASVPCYWMPIEIKLKTNSGDRMIKLMNNTNSMTNFIYCDSTVIGIEIDPDYNIVRKVGQIKQDAAIMNVANTVMKNITVSPNPAQDNWRITNIPAGATMKLTDVQGRVVWNNDSVTTDMIIPAANLAKGNYILMLTVGSDSGYKQLIKY
jgi:aminopeptidase N